MKKKRVPLRTCIGCREVKPKSDLVRIVRTPDGEIRLDNDGKLPGRGAYLCAKKECFQEAMKKKAFGRALKADLENVRPELERMREELESSRTG